MAELNVPNYMTNRPESISDLAESAMRMKESGQNQRMNEMKMAEYQQSEPMRRQLQESEVQTEATKAATGKQNIIGNLAGNVLGQLDKSGITDPTQRQQFISKAIDAHKPYLQNVLQLPVNDYMSEEQLRSLAGPSAADLEKTRITNLVAEQTALQPNKLKEIEAQAGVKFKGATDLEDYKRKNDLNKPMPAKIIQEQNEALESVGNLSATNADLASFKTKLDSGKINLGLFDNISNIARGKVGGNWATDESRQYSELKNTLSKMRDESLMLNKGTQTEGDATRAWTSLFDNLTDNKYVSERLQEIQNINTRAAEIKGKNINLMRSEYSKEPVDMSGYTNQSTAFKSGYAKAEDVLKDVELGKISKDQAKSIINAEFKRR